MTTTDHAIREMIQLANEYCELVEQISCWQQLDWLRAVNHVLPRLQQAVLQLKKENPLCEIKVSQTESDVDEHARFELYSRLHVTLGELDPYRLEQDASTTTDPPTGSLADDFTDIYFDLKRGLQIYNKDASNACISSSEWVCSFDIHWELHLRDAYKQLDRMNKSLHSN